MEIGDSNRGRFEKTEQTKLDNRRVEGIIYFMNWRKWLDGFVLAGKGILLATKEKRFWYGFVPAFLGFGLLMNLLSGTLADFEKMRILGLSGYFEVIGENFLKIFGFGLEFLDWLPMFLISLLQGILIGIVVLLWNKKHSKNSENVEKVGIITGLIALGAGCPTCGTTLVAPLIGVIFSTGSLAITNTVSTIITILAIIIAVLALKRLGEEIYVTIIHEKYLARKKKEESEKSN